MKQNVSSVSSNQAKWSNTQSKNFIIGTVPVKNEVRAIAGTTVQCTTLCGTLA